MGTQFCWVFWAHRGIRGGNRKAVEVDPLSVPVRNMLAAKLASYGHCDESLKEDRKTMELDPNATHLGMIHDRMAECYTSKGMAKEALEARVQSMIANGATPREVEEFKKTLASADKKESCARRCKRRLDAGRKIIGTQTVLLSRRRMQISGIRPGFCVD